MMNSIRHSSKLVMLVLMLVVFASGCKSKKKALEASNAAAEKAKMEQEASARIAQAEEQKRKDAADAAERAQREAEARQNQLNASTPKSKLSKYFSAIASSATPASANSSINEALTLFASPQTPVLIVISESGGMKDYDKPTTIKDYLNYLKDQKKNSNAISNLVMDGSGKITEVELKKN